MADEQSKKISLLRFPKAIMVIMVIESAWSFGIYLRFPLVPMYCINGLHQSEKWATMINHSYSILGTLLYPFGGILADAFAGNYYQYIIATMCYSTTAGLLPLGTIPNLGLPRTELTVISLVATSMFGSFITPVRIPFAIDQFPVPSQNDLVEAYFYYAYWMANIGMAFGGLVSPLMKEYVSCFGETSCYFFPFSSAFVIAVLFTMTLILTKKLYVIKPAAKNFLLVKLAKAVYRALINKRKSTERKPHWLDYANDKYDQPFLDDMKKLRVLYMLLPFPVFFGLYNQQNSTWVFQARRMYSDFFGFVVPPDMTLSINPFLVIAVVPIFDWLVNPILERKKILRTTLKRISFGLIFMLSAFVISGILFFILERDDPVSAGIGKVHLYIYNPHNYTMRVNISTLDEIVDVEEMGFKILYNLKVPDDEITYAVETSANLRDAGILELKPEDEYVGAYMNPANKFEVFEEDLKKSDTGYPIVRHLANQIGSTLSYNVKGSQTYSFESSDISSQEVKVNWYEFLVDGTSVKKEFKLYNGAVYRALVDVANLEVRFLEVTTKNTISLLWMLPQILIVVVSEFFFLVGADQFVYLEAPQSLKAFVQSFWMMVIFFGDPMIVIAEAITPFDRMSHKTFAYTGFMVLTIMLFIFMAMRYTYSSTETEPQEDEKKE